MRNKDKEDGKWERRKGKGKINFNKNKAANISDRQTYPRDILKAMLTLFAKILIFILLNSIIIVKSDLTYQSLPGNSKDTKIPIWSGSLWHNHFNYTEIALVNFEIDRNIFNYCDFKQVLSFNSNPHCIFDVLLLYLVNNNMHTV